MNYEYLSGEAIDTHDMINLCKLNSRSLIATFTKIQTVFNFRHRHWVDVNGSGM